MSILKPSGAKLLLALILYFYPFLINILTALPGLNALQPELLFPYTWITTLFFFFFHNTYALVTAQLWVIVYALMCYIISCLLLSAIGLLTKKK